MPNRYDSYRPEDHWPEHPDPCDCGECAPDTAREPLLSDEHDDEEPF